MKPAIPSSVAFILLICGCFHSPEEPEEYSIWVDDYLSLWQIFQDDCPTMLIMDFNWIALGDMYLPEVLTADSAQFHGILVDMLSLYEDSLIVFSFGDEEPWLNTYVPECQLNVDSAVLFDNYLSNYGFMPCTLGMGFCDPEQLPYLIADTLWGPAVAGLDSCISLYNDHGVQTLILDLRLQHSRRTYQVDHFAGRFTDKTYMAGISRTRSGPAYDNFFDEVTAVKKRGSEQFLGNVIVLVGPGVMYSNERTLIQMLNTGRVTMVGDQTAGKVSLLTNYSTANDLRFWVPYETFLTNDGDWVEGTGLPPDHLVEATPEDFAAGVDPVLEYAISLLPER